MSFFPLIPHFPNVLGYEPTQLSANPDLLNRRGTPAKLRNHTP